MSSTILDARDVARRHGARTVLDAVTLRVHGGDRVALVGRNGSGKSTLLRILAGEEAADGGEARRHGSVAYLPQLVAHPELTPRTAILERIGVGAAEREMQLQAAALESGDLGAIDAHAAALERWLDLGGEDAGARLASAAAECGLAPELLDRPLVRLSGGQASRAGLAAVTVARCDALLLDEPTNHLDEDGLARLRGLLANHRGAVVLVSHDRALQAEVADTVVELTDGRARYYAGGWEAFERERADTRAREAREYEAALAERGRLAAVDREIRRRAAASSTHADPRGARDNDKNGREWVRSRAQGMERRAARLASRRERVAVPERPPEAPKLALKLSAAQARDRTAVALQRAELRRGEWRLGPVDLAVSYGDRLLLAGPNGAGKSSLLAALEGTMSLVAGCRVLAPSAVVATLGQDRLAVDGELSPVACLRAATGLDETTARTALAAFGLGSERVERSAATLSPGERTRAELALAAHSGATCLLLDEPTNHLDVESLEVLEAALEDWPGALVVASHDRRFREALRLDGEFALPR